MTCNESWLFFESEYIIQQWVVMRSYHTRVFLALRPYANRIAIVDLIANKLIQAD